MIIPAKKVFFASSEVVESAIKAFPFLNFFGGLRSKFDIVKFANLIQFEAAAELIQSRANGIKNWDFIYFGGNHVYGEKPIKISDRILKLNGTVALQCVALNKSLFETLLILLPQMKKQVDAYYADLHDVYNAYGFFPNMAKQKAGYSDIQNGFVDYTNYFKD